ncbi:hypothetical protein M595_3445 [Lyngbya aestuarii BL J]|uniref:Uncharacterized protein n=2 Tax=Lyngbya aestuarii TaxID=118322 RepID=U7QHN3_9CYAN|nr:hypothetical protein M595_3445 [Lyngbya aestuarii BL J]
MSLKQGTVILKLEKLDCNEVNKLTQKRALTMVQFQPKTQTKTKVSSLPDGNYRYVTASTPITDAELAQTESLIFLFRKKGNDIIGQLSQANSSNSICISGQVNGNTITGAAVELSEPFDEAILRNCGEDFVVWDVAGSLRVRRGRKEGKKVIYKSAIFDLNGYNRINAGTQFPPASCPF